MVKSKAAKAAGKWSSLPSTAVCDECYALVVVDELMLARGCRWVLWGLEALRFWGFCFFDIASTDILDEVIKVSGLS